MIEATALSLGRSVYHPRLEKAGVVLARRGQPDTVWLTRHGTRVMVEVDGQFREWKLTSIWVPKSQTPASASAPAGKQPKGARGSYNLHGACSPSEDAHAGQVDPDAEGD